MKKIKNLTQEDYKELSQKLNSLKKKKIYIIQWRNPI